MSSSAEANNVTVVSGNLLKSQMQTLVNTVNTVGVMGKGIALAFKKAYPAMFEDYVARCERGEVALGRPYVYKAADRLIVNFPTKAHWRAVSRLSDIEEGLEHLAAHYREWGVTSIAVPPLGCGNGQLEWDVVGPTLVRHLSRLDIPVELYAPSGASVAPGSVLFGAESTRDRRVPAEWLAVVAVLDRLQRQRYRWPVGRVMFQKLTYFATQAGIPTGLEFERGSYGPYAADLKRRIAQLQNNGLATEASLGQMLEVRVGSTYRDAVTVARDQMEPYRAAVERTVDLMARMNTREAEVAATVHYVATEVERATGALATVGHVIASVEAWKPLRFRPDEVVDAIALLCMRDWARIDLDEKSISLVEERLSA